MKTKTILLLIIASATAYIAYMYWGKNREGLSGLGLGTGLLNQGIGAPSYEGYTPNAEKKEEKQKEGFCGACS
jgi:hypothetical protein